MSLQTPMAPGSPHAASSGCEAAQALAPLGLSPPLCCFVLVRLLLLDGHAATAADAGGVHGVGAG